MTERKIDFMKTDLFHIGKFVIHGYKKRKFWFTALASFELSLSVECIQLVTKTGCFDVDDIFLNTIGGMLGYLVYALVQRKRDRDADARRLKEQKH